MVSVANISRHAVRRLLRAPSFTAAAALTLTLGIAGTAAVFMLVDGVLLRPLPYDHAERLTDLSHDIDVGSLTHIDQSDATYLLYRRDNRAFTDIAAYRSDAVNLGTTGGRDGTTAERVSAVLTTGSLFRVLRTPVQLGRPLGDDDDLPGAPPVVVIGGQLWQRAFGGDPSTVGRRVLVDGVMRTVVGVMPASFHFPDAESAVWVPLTLDPTRTKSAAFDFRGVGRLRDGASLETAAADLQRVLPRVPEVFPGRLTANAITHMKMRVVVRPLRDVVVGDVGRVLWIVLGAVAVLLFVACANVANLFLARVEGRQRELAVRRALGAGRGALLAEFLSEAVLVAVMAGVLGLVLAAGGVGVLKSNAGAAIPRLAEVGVDGVVVAVTVMAVAVSAMLVSALPVFRLDRASLSATLMANGQSTTAARGRHRARRSLVIAQVGLALVLLAGAGLLARSFAQLRSVNPGFVAERAVAFRLSLPTVTYPEARDAGNVVARTLDAIKAIPGVQSTGVITQLPLDAESKQDSAVFVEDHPLQPGEFPGVHQIEFVTPGYFAAMGMPLVAGKMFDAPDPSGAVAGGPPAVIVSEAFAARYWPGAQAVGKRVRMTFTDPWHTVIGVVGNVRGAGVDQPPSELVYAPLVTLSAAGTPWTPRDLAFVVRTSGDAAVLATAVRRAVASVDPALPVFRLMPLTSLLSAATARTTFTLFLLAVAAVVATAIGAVGIYGVISYLVTLRTREIGVRMALGADATDVRRLFARQAIVDASIGVVLGLLGALALTRSLGAVLFDVSPSDPVALGVAAIVLLLAAALASWVPARRAAALDPAVALRGE